MASVSSRRMRSVGSRPVRRQHHALDLLLGGVAAAGQALFDGRGGQGEDGHAGFFEHQADRAAHVRHQQRAPRMARRGEDFFERDEVGLIRREHLA